MTGGGADLGYLREGVVDMMATLLTGEGGTARAADPASVIAAWREREAQSKDVPRSRVLKDDILIEIALAAPRTAEALGGEGLAADGTIVTADGGIDVAAATDGAVGAGEVSDLADA